MIYRITYFAPYNMADFTCEAASVKEGRAAREAYNNRKGFLIESRHVKTETFNGRKAVI